MNVSGWIRTVLVCVVAWADPTGLTAQVPPSIRSSTVRGAPTRLSDADQTARCADLKALISILTPEADTPIKKREVADYERMRGGLACGGTGVLSGKWNLVATPPAGGPIAWTWNLTPITKDAGEAMVKEQWGGFRASMCEQFAPFFYHGTVEFRSSPTYNGNNPFQLWVEGTGSVLVCASSADSGSGWAYLRDINKYRGFRMQLSGDGTALSGGVIPEAPIGGPTSFKATR